MIEESKCVRCGGEGVRHYLLKEVDTNPTRMIWCGAVCDVCIEGLADGLWGPEEEEQ